MTWSDRKKTYLTKDLEETKWTKILISWNVKEANNVNEILCHLSKENSEKLVCTLGKMC